MVSWRHVFGFHRQKLDYEAVHARYRELTMTLPMPVTLDDLQKLNWALEEARRELGEELVQQRSL